MSAPSVAEAEARAAQARERLKGTVATLQDRLQPRNVLSDVTETASNASRRALATTVEAAERKPVAAIGAAALLVAFLGRHRLAGLFRRSNRIPNNAFLPADADTKDFR
jgi:ElaB/YqjD/DUF883 family membrane-anchored ribosome-binding protein